MSLRPLAALAVLLAAGCGDHHSGPVRPAVFQVAVGSGLRPDEVATAFAIGPGRAVTVAHVLGRRAPGATVRLQGGRTATILTVDERDDLALLAVPGLDAPRAKLAAASGDVVVIVLRRGRVQRLPASVRRPIIARIRTPDGRNLVRRRALELRADVGPGDSGAPVVAPDGRVAGVVFAQSDLHQHIAYAVDVSGLEALRPPPGGRS